MAAFLGGVAYGVFRHVSPPRILFKEGKAVSHLLVWCYLLRESSRLLQAIANLITALKRK